MEKRLVESFEEFTSKKSKTVSSVKRNPKLNNNRNNKTGRINEMARLSGVDLSKVKAVNLLEKGETYKFISKILLMGGSADQSPDMQRQINITTLAVKTITSALDGDDGEITYIFKVDYTDGEYEIYEILSRRDESVKGVIFKLVNDEQTLYFKENGEDYDFESVDIDNWKFSDDVERYEVELSKNDIIKYYSK
jgi:hypothetical protein